AAERDRVAGPARRTHGRPDGRTHGRRPAAPRSPVARRSPHSLDLSGAALRSLRGPVAAGRLPVEGFSASPGLRGEACPAGPPLAALPAARAEKPPSGPLLPRHPSAHFAPRAGRSERVTLQPSAFNRGDRVDPPAERRERNG